MAGAIETRINFTDPLRIAHRVIAGLVVCRLMFLIPFVAAFDLVGDESYYWDWGRRLDWGYFSKPPMIGWLMGLVGRLSGDSEWGIRIGALVFGTASLVLLRKLAAKLYGDRVALVALLLAALTPANAALSLLFTIDAPLVLCWTAALLVFWDVVQDPGRRSRWIWLTLLLGLGHLSKQMMLVFPMLMILYAALQPSTRPLLRLPAFWICIFTSLLFLVPMIWWNAQHDWVTLKHTSHHFDTRANLGILDHAGSMLSFIGLQALAFSPLSWVLLVAVAVGGFWKWRELHVKERFLVLFSAPGLCAFALLSLRQNVNPNWPAVFYLSATVLAAAWVNRMALHCLPWQKLRAWLKPALWVGAAVTVMGYLLPFAITWIGLAGSAKLDPALRLRGWKEVGQRAGEFLSKVPDPKNTFVIVLGHRDQASQLAFYMPQKPRVYRYVYREIVESQYEIWPDPGDYAFTNGDAILFAPTDDPFPASREIPHSLRRQFRDMEELGDIRVPIGNKWERHFDVFLMRGLKFWDPPLSRDTDPDKPAETPQPDKASAN